MSKLQSTGHLGEQLAKEFLLHKGYRILATHFTCRWGELDIIAFRDGKIAFVEVKTRTSNMKGRPYEAVTYFKLRHLSRPIQFYILQNKLSGYKLSLDVISVVLDRFNNPTSITHYENVSTLPGYF